MANLQWQDVNAQSNSMGELASQFMATAKDTTEKIQRGINPFSGLQHENYVTPQEYFSKDWADKFMNQQTDLWNRFNTQAEEFQKERESFHQQRENWLNEKEQLVNQFGSYTPEANYETNSNEATGFSKTQQAFYDVFRSKGLSHNQSMAIMANIQAENSWDDRYVFGTHQDGKRTAYGALSWQGGREALMLKELQQAGLYNPVFKTISNDPRAATIQANHIYREMMGSQSGALGDWLKRKDDSFIKLTNDFSGRYVRPSTDSKVQAGRQRNYKNFYQTYSKKAL